MLVRVKRGAFKAHIETHGAAYAAFRLPLHAARALKPVIFVVVSIHERHAKLLSKADILLFTQLILFQRMNIRVVEENGVVDAGGEHRFHHFAGAGGAAGVQQHFIVSAGQRQRLTCEGFRHK